MGAYARIVEALIARIDGHRKKGGILDGFKWEPLPKTDVTGESDFPFIRLWLPDISEEDHPRDLVDGTMNLRLTVSSSRKAGLVAFTRNLETVMDAIELNDELVKDLGLSNTLVKALVAQARDNFANELSFNAQITLSVQAKVFVRGNRRT